jgi:peptidoglycan hydrolase-like protein with peptidoglycan-binding domain
MTTPDEVLRIATQEIGYSESPPDSNRTKFGAWYGLDGVQWCGIFVSFCFYEAGLPLPPAKPREFVNPKGFAFCPFGIEWFRDQGRLLKTPQVGDVVFYNWSGSRVAEHVGIVEAVNADGSVISIEGNTAIANNSNGGKVMRRGDHPLNTIVGFGRPVYIETAPNLLDQVKVDSLEGVIRLTTPPMKGTDVLKWQLRMIYMEWDLGRSGITGRGDDGIFGRRCRDVLIQFQESKGLPITGVLDQQSWNATWEA